MAFPQANCLIKKSSISETLQMGSCPVCLVKVRKRDWIESVALKVLFYYMQWLVATRGREFSCGFVTRK